MSLKGYQWLNKKGEVTMSYTFKDLSVDVWQDVSEEEYNKFMDYIKNNGFTTSSCDFHNHFCLSGGELLYDISYYENKGELEQNEKDWLERLRKVIEKGN